ncbi:MAG: glycerophosphodiester phosphodiesterase [Clostridia bacterium]|nr:glycerophosphodiester phosphodiesterase [Clostridia bacterium]
MFTFILLLLVVLPLLHFLMISPDRKRMMPGNSLCGRSYAHRGLHSLRNQVPENSLQAFSYAASRGYGIELDVRLSADGQVVVFHDDNLSRMTDDPRLVSAVTYEELRTLSLNGTSQTIPLFSEALEVIGGRVPLLIELKPGANRDELCRKVWELLQGYEGDYAVQSFDPRSLNWFRRNAPQVWRGQLSTNLRLSSPSMNPILAWALTNLYMNFLSRPHFVSYDVNFFGNRNLRSLRVRHGMASAAWTVDNTNDYENVVKYAQMIIFEGILPPIRFDDSRSGVTRRERTPAGGKRR